MNNEHADIELSIHLTASAGSGKTRALKERYLALLNALDDRGLSAEQAVAITFTDKAAAEIKERVLGGLSEPMLRKIVRGSESLRISTIHSFCMNLLKRYPLEAGVPPDFGILNTRDRADKIDRAVADALDHTDRDPSFAAVFESTDAERIVSDITRLFAFRNRLNRIMIDSGGTDRLLQRVRDSLGIDRARAEMSDLLADPAWKTALHAMEQELSRQNDQYELCKGGTHVFLADCAAAEGVRDAVHALRSVYFNKDGSAAKRPAIPKNRFQGSRRTEYESLYFTIQSLLERFLSLDDRSRAGQRALVLLELFLLAEERYQTMKLREGVLDFDDLEISAYRLLQSAEAPDILYWLDRRILHFLVDEFQDTSDIQWAILNKLTEEIFSGRGTDKPMRATLFLVGDEKQSIYRFREANYRLMENVRRRMETSIPGDELAIRTLDTNYRSAPEIVVTVNSVFGTLWADSFRPAIPHRRDEHGSVRLIELAPAAADTKNPSEAVILAREIAASIRRGLAVFDSSGPRPARFEDCAVLIQSRTRLKEYETALRAESIPFRVVGGIGFFEEDEVQALMNVLFFLDNADDRLALFAALKSELFGVTDRELYDVAMDAGDPLDALHAARPGAAALFKKWVSLAGLVPLSALLHRIVADTGAYIRFGRTNRQALFNIDKLLDTAREFDRRGYTTLQDFAAWIRSIRGSDQREAAADMNLPAFSGSVSILTVHKAKGLEFPIVFLPGLNQRPYSLTRGPDVLFSPDVNAGIAVREAGNRLYDELWKEEQNELRREHQRLLYVAMTRARDHLFMLASRNDGNDPAATDTWLSYLRAAAPIPLFNGMSEYDDGSRSFSYPVEPGPAVPSENAVPSGKTRDDGMPVQQFDPGAVIAHISPVPAGKGPEWKRATDFIDQGKKGPDAPAFHTPSSDAVSPLLRGVIVHRCLENLARLGVYDIEEVIAGLPETRQIAPNDLSTFMAGVRAMLDAVTANPALSWVFDRSPQAYSELPFLFKREHAYVSGIMDRVVLADGKALVVDYKTIRIGDDSELKEWNDHYLPQLRIYCEAAVQIFGVKSAEGYLLYLDSNRLEKVIAIV